MKFIRSNWFRDVLQRKFMAAVLVAVAPVVAAETGEEAWLRYAALDAKTAKNYEHLASRAEVLGDSPVLKSAQAELARGISRMLGRTLQVDSRNPPSRPTESVLILGTLSQIHGLAPDLLPAEQLVADGYWLKSTRIGRAGMPGHYRGDGPRCSLWCIRAAEQDRPGRKHRGAR